MSKISDSNQTANGVSNKDLIFQSNLRKFSFFKKPIGNVEPYQSVSMVDTYKIVKGEYFKFQTEQLRKISDTKQARKYKSLYFNYVTFSGVFSRRSNNALMEHSGFMVIDFDHLPEVLNTKEILLKDIEIETQLLFLSPSGNGLKWVIEIDLKTATHQEYFYGIRNYLKQKYHLSIDESGKDISRACFLPHDKDVFINPKYLANDF